MKAKHIYIVEGPCKCNKKMSISINKKERFQCSHCNQVLDTVIFDTKKGLIGKKDLTIDIIANSIDELKELKIEKRGFEDLIRKLEEDSRALENKIEYQITIIEKKESAVREISDKYEGMKKELKDAKESYERLIREKEIENGRNVLEVKELQTENAKLNEALAQMKCIKEEAERNNLELKDKAADIEVYKTEIAKLNEALEQMRCLKEELEGCKLELKNKASEAETDKREIASLKNDFVNSRKKLAKYESEINDLNHTVIHLKSVQKDMESIDIRGIVKIFLEYVSDIQNFAYDGKSLESLVRMIDVRTEQLEMVAAGKGLTINSHKRGERIGNVPAVMQSVETDDESLNATVKKTRCIGCSFKSNRIDDIPEDIVVYAFHKDEPPKEEQPKEKQVIQETLIEEPPKEEQPKDEPIKEEPVIQVPPNEEPPKEEQPKEEPQDAAVPTEDHSKDVSEKEPIIIDAFKEPVKEEEHSEGEQKEIPAEQETTIEKTAEAIEEKESLTVQHEEENPPQTEQFPDKETDDSQK